MEVREKHYVKEKCRKFSSGDTSDTENNDGYRSQNSITLVNASEINTNYPNIAGKNISSKSDSWFIVGSNNQFKMLLPNKNIPQFYFTCGDIEVMNKYPPKITLTDEELLKKLKPCQDCDNKVKELKHFLEKNLEIADLKINMYISACNRHCLSPYPTYVIEESAIGMESLVLVNDFIPPVALLQQYLNNDKISPNEHVINVLHWLLVTFKEPNFNLVTNDKFRKILEKVEHLSNIKLPDHLFVLKYKRLNEDVWLSEKEYLGSKFAFLPVNMEHAHSIIHLGVHPKIFIDGVHGLGVYLTTDLNCCLQSIPAQWVWGKSTLGIETQIVMIAEFLNHPSVIAYSEKKALCKEQNPQFNNITGTMYYFIPSHQFIRLRYVMLYIKTKSTLKTTFKSKKKKVQENIRTYKQAILFLTLTISAIILAKRLRFASVAKGVFTNIASLPLIRHCLSIIN